MPRALLNALEWRDSLWYHIHDLKQQKYDEMIDTMNLNRRTFINGLAAGGVSSFFNIGCAGFGQCRVRQIAKGAKIRVALIGCGARMCQLLEPLMTENVVALVDPDPQMIARTKAKMADVPGAGDLAKVRVFADYRDLYEQMADEIDAAVIATPNHHHAPAALLAMRKGLHVYVEKPMALTVAEVKLMRAAAARDGLGCLVRSRARVRLLRAR